MKVFQAWGPHIKKFAMAFDVEEGELVILCTGISQL